MAGARTIHDADALLLYRVGPVYCCSPTMPVVSVQLPPKLSHPPGSNVSRPGVFRFTSGIVRVVDLRQCFGVDEEDREHPGNIVVTEVEGGLAGFWVDEIIDVIQCPRQGWGSVPALVPRDVFTRTLLFNDHIQLYAEFEKFNDFRETGYLRQHIQALKTRLQSEQKVHDKPPSSGPVAPALSAPADAEDRLAAEVRAAGSAASQPPDHAPDADATTAAGQPAPASSGQRTEHRPASRAEQPGGSSAAPSTGAGPGQAAQRAPAITRSQRPSKSSAAVSATVGLAAASAQPAPRPSMPPRQDPQAHVRGSVDAVMAQPARADYGLWALLAIVLLLVVLGAYLFTDSGQQQASPQTGRVQPAPAPVKSVERNTQAKADDQVAMPRSGDAAAPRANRQVTPSAAAGSDRPPAEQAQQARRSAAGDEPQAEPAAPLPGLPRDLPAVDDGGQQAYRATINKDDQGLVIMLDAPEDESLTDQPTATTAASEDSFLPEGDVPATEQKQLAESNGDMPTGHASEAATAQPNRPQASQTIIHVVVRGDTLWHIAKRYIHNPYRYPELARLSKINNPDLIYPGDRVKIIINKTRRK